MAKADPNPTPETADEADMARLEEQIGVLRADIARIADTLAALGKTSGEALHATLRAKADALRAEGEAHMAEAGQSAEAALAEVSDFARRKPVQALAFAGGLGLLLGLVFGRR